MVHFSSDLVYSGANSPYSEGSAAVPLSLYGWSKLLADTLVLRTCRDSLIVRTSVLCGNARSSRATFSEEILSGDLRRVFVNSWRSHTPIEWLAGLVPSILSEGVRGLVIASGGVCRSRSAYAQELLRSHGMSWDNLEFAYAPPGVPERLDLRGRYTAPSDIV
jgi:dTDP-4-dehydrorhamnose reductase